MRVKVLFFGATAETVGQREIEISLDENINAETALESIFAEYPSLEQNHSENLLHFSVNQEYASGSESIRDGDELAVFTAVSGG